MLSQAQSSAIGYAIMTLLEQAQAEIEDGRLMGAHLMLDRVDALLTIELPEGVNVAFFMGRSETLRDLLESK